jgi:hypothetical protein
MAGPTYGCQDYILIVTIIVAVAVAVAVAEKV